MNSYETLASLETLLYNVILWGWRLFMIGAGLTLLYGIGLLRFRRR